MSKKRTKAWHAHPLSTPTTKKRRPATSSSRRYRAQHHWGAWAGVFAVVAAVSLMFWLSRSPGGHQQSTAKGEAPNFTLTATDGRQVSLSDYKGKRVLLYFNEGVGCDACFYQMGQLEKDAAQLRRDGVTVMPIAVNPPDQVRSELSRFGLQTPWLIDSSMAVSNEYGVIGTGMHADMPGHSFVYVNPSGRIAWRGDFPSMYVSTHDLLKDIGVHA